MKNNYDFSNAKRNPYVKMFKWGRKQIKQKWNKYKRGRSLRSCRNGQDELDYIFQRMRSICWHLEIPLSKLDSEAMQVITNIAGKEYRAKTGNVSLCSRKTKTKDYREVDIELLPVELRRVVEGAYYYENLTGFLCTLYEWESKSFIKVQYINDISKSLWLAVRITGQQTASSDVGVGIYLDYFWSDFDELTKFKGLYFAERNKTIFSYILCNKNSQDEEDHRDYLRWVTQVELKQLLYKKSQLISKG